MICVGSTGTGKSTLIKIMTGADIEISSRADSVTKTSSVFTKKRGLLGLQGRKPLQYWIDTQGWEDSDIEKQDNQIFKDIFQVTFQVNKIFKDIFQCLWDSEMTEISGIVWNINPNERATDTLQRQARLILITIEMFTRTLDGCVSQVDPKTEQQGGERLESRSHCLQENPRTGPALPGHFELRERKRREQLREKI